nr:MAG TPA: hypothetical protein [Caudoviricetes sp.]
MRRRHDEAPAVRLKCRTLCRTATCRNARRDGHRAPQATARAGCETRVWRQHASRWREKKKK